MLHTISLNENKQFKRLYYRGKNLPSPLVVLYHAKGVKGVNRLGVTVSTKIGHAVVRNRVRRRIKEAYRLIEPTLTLGNDFVLVARTAAIGCDFGRLCRDMTKLFQKAGTIKE